MRRTTPIGEWLQLSRQLLAGQRIQDGESQPASSPNLEVQVLLGHVLAKPRAWILAHPEFQLNPAQETALNQLLERLQAGDPLPYLTGHQEFYGLDFEVTPDVLIPRPETEGLVDHALDWLHRHPSARKAVDVGTGSGCIAVALAKHRADLELIAVDRSWNALQVARRNATKHGVSGQIHFVQGDLLSAAGKPMDLICANLPYIPQDTLDGLPVSRFEPRLALDGGPDGLAFIHALIADSPRWLAPEGLLLLEMQFDQGEAIKAIVQRFLPEAQIEIIPDLAGMPRVVAIQASSN